MWFDAIADFVLNRLISGSVTKKADLKFSYVDWVSTLKKITNPKLSTSDTALHCCTVLVWGSVLRYMAIQGI